MANTQNFGDFMKVFGEFKPLDFNQVFSMQRRNMEAFSAANQAVTEGVQAASRRQAEVAREGVEQFLKASKDLFTGSSPEMSAAKQVDFAKNMFEATLNNMREVSEMFTKSSYEAFDVLNKRAAENMDEMAKFAPKKTGTK